MEILRCTYDNMESLLNTSVEREGAEPVLLCSNTYDDLGRLATHSLGGTAEGSHAIIRTVPLMVVERDWDNPANYPIDISEFN